MAVSAIGTAWRRHRLVAPGAAAGRETASIVKGASRSGGLGGNRLQLRGPARDRRARQVAEDRRIRLARRPAVRAALVDDRLAQLEASRVVPQRAEIEAVVAQVADLLAPDRAGVEVPVSVDEAGGGQRRARQRRLTGLVIPADQRLIPILEELHRVQCGA